MFAELNDPISFALYSRTDLDSASVNQVRTRTFDGELLCWDFTRQTDNARDQNRLAAAAPTRRPGSP